jgi:hypothetical protein
MSKTTRVPFFARFIETEAPAINTNVRAGAESGGGANDYPPTKKYPCDGDDTYGTLKGGTEYDEKW